VRNRILFRRKNDFEWRFATDDETGKALSQPPGTREDIHHLDAIPLPHMQPLISTIL
jgi:hypothetical protein